jgi:regulator of RNase E activity RraB
MKMEKKCDVGAEIYDYGGWQNYVEGRDGDDGREDYVEREDHKRESQMKGK